MRRLRLALLVLGAALLTALSSVAAASAAQETPAPVAPATGTLQLVLQHTHGKSYAFTGETVVVRGIVIPYVPAQQVTVDIYSGSHKLLQRTVSVLDLGNGAGQFHVSFQSEQSGLIAVRATHAATLQQGAFGATPLSLRLLSGDLSEGDHGSAVRLLQDELNGLHFAVPLSGTYDEATGRAVIAYRKMTGLTLVPTTNATVFGLLDRGAGKFRVRYPGDGRHIEANLTKQVLAEIEPGGRVRRLYTMSSGKPSTPTVVGRFQVYLRTPGVNSEGMVDSSYFIRGYAIHGYAEVPTYAASHGCLRVPIPDAPAIYAWLRYGTPVDVYNENGSGSRSVSPNAGP